MTKGENASKSVKELLKKVRRIEIKARGLTQQLFSGQYHAAFKGRGMSFSEVRAYTYGDDVKAIDWNVTARMRSPFIKVFEEERELSVMIMVDISGSSIFGSEGVSKRDVMAELAAVIAFSAMQNNDKVGLILFSSSVEHFVPPGKGKSHVLRLIRDLIFVEPKHQNTDIGMALNFMAGVIKKRSTVFLISDLGDGKFRKSLRGVVAKHDLRVIQIEDTLEYQLPNLGLIAIKDPETNKTAWLDTRSAHVRKYINAEWTKRNNEIKLMMSKEGVDCVTVNSKMGYIKPLKQLFQQRGWKK
jgi:uncharacterized protein (DUF58 family)